MSIRGLLVTVLLHITLLQVALSDDIGDYKHKSISEEMMYEAVTKSDDFSHVKLSLDLLGWMCDGQNRDLQNYFREQPGQIKPINVVGEVALFIQQFFSGITFEFHHDVLTDAWPAAAKLDATATQTSPLTVAVGQWRYIYI